MSRSAAQIRREFIDFFCGRHGHSFVPSSPVVPHGDPTLLFANAGMNQFKPLFLGTADPRSEFGRLKRAANSQKCIRAGGKHNDLDDVGHDTYHHTFFEMLGNWSFGDYFKAEAIAWAWELLTGVWGIDPTRLHATYFGGTGSGEQGTGEETKGRKDGGTKADDGPALPPDLEARELWLRILPPERVHPGSMKDNFWEMGDTGPCGPCSEVHIDLTPDKSGGKLVNAGDARVMEIWNLVFIQFNRNADRSLTPLPARHVDTGMGFERICSVVQGIEAGRLGQFSNYDTDVFTPIFAAIQRATGAPAYGGRLEGRGGAHGDVMRDIAYRVIADHIRTLTFAITDGAVPDKDGRGFVLRRILRRAVRYGWQYLNVKQPFLHKLVPAVVDAMSEAFPELRSAHGGRSAQHVEEVVRDEETSFARTLDRGIALFDEAAEAARRDHHGEIRGDDAFKLHDTYGFPIDLTEIMAKERGLSIDIGEYERLMEEAREKARGDQRAMTDPFEKLSPDTPCDDSFKYIAPYECSAFVTSRASMSVLAATAEAQPGQEIVFSTNKTPFYAEQGGQVADTGAVTWDGGLAEVTQVHRRGEHVLHLARVSQAAMPAGATVMLRVDAPRRQRIMQNHTATHILNWSLREVLGDHIQQKGSLVDPDKTRFDFSHGKALGDEEIDRIESLCTEQIGRNLKVETNDNIPVSQQAALKVNGLRAVFGEKYPDEVRVVSIGVPVRELLANPGNPEWRKFSIEFCGGTHVRRTGEIGAFVLTHEEAVAKGVRRLVGISGDAARAALKRGADLEDTARQAVAAARSGDKAADEALAKTLADLQDALAADDVPLRTRHHLRSALAELQEAARKQHKAATADAAATIVEHADRLLTAATRVGPTSIVVGELPDAPAEALKHGADVIRQKAGSAAVCLGVRSGAKATLIVAMTDDLIKRGLKAGDLVKAIAPIIEGGGGGPPTLAQAGGKNPAKLAEALAAGTEWIRTRLG